MRETPRVWGYNSGENCVGGLIDLCNDVIRPHHIIAEIGCFAGVSTAVFANYAKHVIAVDPWTLAEDYGEIPRDAVAAAEGRFADVLQEYDNITCIRNFSVPAADDVAGGAVDLVYIDGEHTEAVFRADVAAWQSKIKPGGILAGHDYNSVAAWLHCAVDKVYSDSSWIIRT